MILGKIGSPQERGVGQRPTKAGVRGRSPRETVAAVRDWERGAFKPRQQILRINLPQADSA